MFSQVYEVLLSDSPIGVNELARRIKRPVASVHRFLTKDGSGQFTRTPDKKWMLANVATEWPDKEDKELVESWLKDKDLTSILKYIKELQEISNTATLKIKFLRAHAGSQLYHDTAPVALIKKETKKEQTKKELDREKAIEEIIRRVGEEGYREQCEDLDDNRLRETLTHIKRLHWNWIETEGPRIKTAGESSESWYRLDSEQFSSIADIRKTLETYGMEPTLEI